MNKYVFSAFNHSPESVWRSLILFGDNDKCYKFALGKTLLHFATLNKDEIIFDDFISVYLDEICDHIKKIPTQGTNAKPPGRVLDNCILFNNKKIDKDKLIEIAKSDEWVVLKKFHLMKKEYVPFKFFDFKKKKYKKQYRQNKKIILTDDLLKLNQNAQFNNLLYETESRWNLVENSWHLKIPQRALMIEYNLLDENLLVNRTNLTGARNGLNGYQKGKCFYCLSDIEIESRNPNLSDVDHFFPLTLEDMGILKNLNGVWNLVLACKKCNRGEFGKFDRLADIKFLEKLEHRNNFLIFSHDPLKQTLIKQTGKDIYSRRKFLNENFQKATQVLIHYNWKPKEIYI
tara:strand:- start:165 stop:1199 length:1035 start_codon:yes stop_codon:yes gene_type:complete